MTVLAPATEVSQKDGEVGDWNHCGEADMTSILADDHRRVPLVDVVTWVRNNDDNPDRGTPETWVVHYLNAHGLPSVMTGGDGEIDASLNRRHRLIWLVWSDGRGNINGSRHSSHYVVVWGHGDGVVHVMNSLGDPSFGSNQAIPEGTFFANSQGWGIEITKTVAADLGGSQQPQGDVMTPAQSSAVATALVRSLQHAGVDIGSGTDQPNAAVDLAHALEAGDAGTVVKMMDGATYNRRTHGVATAIVRSLQRFGVDIGSGTDQPNATADLAAALEASDSTAVERIIDGATFNRRTHAVATALIRSLQHLGVDIGSAGDEPNATADLATALENSDSAAVERIMDGAKFPAHQ